MEDLWDFLKAEFPMAGGERDASGRILSRLDEPTPRQSAQIHGVRALMYLVEPALSRTEHTDSADRCRITHRTAVPQGIALQTLRAIRYLFPHLARADLDEASQIAEPGPMRLHMADIHLHRARLFFREEPYPWTSPQADLAAGRQLIEQRGYWRRKEGLEDAEKGIGVGTARQRLGLRQPSGAFDRAPNSEPHLTLSYRPVRSGKRRRAAAVQDASRTTRPTVVSARADFDEVWQIAERGPGCVFVCPGPAS
jgi:hypothetical protein